MSGPAIVGVNGPVVEVEGMEGAHVLDLVELGPQKLTGEVIALRDGVAVVQAHEYTGGLGPGAPAALGGGPLQGELGPGLLGGVFDGMLRRLDALGERLAPGSRAPALPQDRRWPFQPSVRSGDDIDRGAVLGTVQETEAIETRILVPPDAGGRVEWVADPGEYTVTDAIAVVGGRSLRLAQWWPLRRPRPVRLRIPASVPLNTGQRALDLLFPVARGSTAAVPGGFGTGKTVLLQQIAKWCDADVIVYVSCGERGNELAGVLEEISTLEDPRTGRSLLDRTVLIANTSDMPLMAREVSVHAGVTVAELYRDMGYDALVIADSTSRWAEALRELGSRTGELPAEEGYPASLGPTLASFYERAARAQTLAGGVGSVSILGAISPPGGDLAEPVTAHTARFVRNLWSLDRDLAYARHYPSVSWTASSSRDAALVARWHADAGDPAWGERRARALSLLANADRVQTVADLVGAASLPDNERVVLLTGRLLRDAVLQQNALSADDAWCAPPQAGRAARARARAPRPGDRARRRWGPGCPHRGGRPLGCRPRARSRGARRRRGRRGDRPLARIEAGGRRVTAPIEHTRIASVDGPLIVVADVEAVGWDEIAEIRLASGEVRHGVVLDVHRDLAVVEVFEGTAGVGVEGVRVAFTGSPMRIPVGEGWLGRICNGRGEPLDGGPPILGERTRDVAGEPINPARRAPPRDPVLTGVSAIDGLATLVRGQKLPIFSVGGLPHLELAAQVAAHASAEGEAFAVVFAGIGITHADAADVGSILATRSAEGDLVVLLNTADDPLVERVVTPRIALTIAEDLAFAHGRHVLVVTADLTSYCEALREVSSARGEIPSRRGYPGHLYSDLAAILERAGRIRGREGSVTQLPVLTMPGGDINHPVPDTTGYITEGQLVLSPDLHAQGVYPPFDALSSLSRLMRLGAGPGRTRADHLELAAQIYALAAEARRAAELAEVLGEDALAPAERRRLEFAAAMNLELLAQAADENRSLEETLDRGWRIVSRLPRAELTMLSDAALDAHYGRDGS